MDVAVHRARSPQPPGRSPALGTATGVGFPVGSSIRVFLATAFSSDRGFMPMHRVITWFLRIFFGLLLVTSAVGKLLDNRGFAQVIETYQLPLALPLLLPLALLFSLGELVLGLAVFAGVQLRVMAQLTIALHAFYFTLATTTVLRGLKLKNCGCFGVFLARPVTWQTSIEDAVLTGLAVGFWLCVRPAAAVPGRRGPIRVHSAA
jgi:uncharacterized membrane protein YphA (DoxX/SURF4 family)